MTHDQFEALVGKLETRARSEPRLYPFKVLLLAMLGNAYLGAMLLLIVALLLALLASVTVLKAAAAKLIIVVGVFLWMILKALWVKIDPPAGTEVKAAQAPELFAMIDELRRRLRAPRFHHVLITDDFNAAVVQSPRLGIFGWPRNYLLIGLPLMKTMTVEQFKAVLAHEFGHLARGHGKMSNWLYRQRLRWGRLLDALEASESRGSFLFKPFLKWFAPYFNAYSFPLARANEYQADATSARLTSPRAAAEALTSVNVLGSYLSERYWPGIYGQADDQPQPGFAPYRGMGQGVATELDEASTGQWLEQALAQQTSVADTHPSLADRLKAIGEAPRLAPPPAGEAADRLLGPALEAIEGSFDERWKAHVAPSWEERHRKVQAGRQRLAELDAQAAGGAELTLQEAYDRAILMENVPERVDEALGELRALNERAPDDPVLCLALGARLLARDDGAGRALVERAIERHEASIAEGCQLLRDWCWRTGREGEAHDWHRRLVERSELEQAAEKERSQVTTRDKFERHGLSDGDLAQLRAELKAVPGLRKAYLVKKRVQHMEHRPCWVLGYSVTGPFRRHRKERAEQALRQIQATVGFPGETLIVCIDGPNYPFGRKFRWMRGTRVV